MTTLHNRLTAVCFLFALFLPMLLSAQDGKQQVADLGRCTLESGKVIEHCIVGYRLFGKLNAGKNNAVLMPTYLYGKSGELSGLFGEKNSRQRLVDTARFFGIAVDALGNGISSSLRIANPSEAWTSRNSRRWIWSRRSTG